LRTPQFILEFLKDDFFIRHTCHPTPDTEAAWESYFNLHPDKKEAAHEARNIILDEETWIEMPELFYESCKNGIFNSIN